MYKNETEYSLVAAIVFIAVLVAAAYHGNGGRIIAAGKTSLVVDSPEKAYKVWEEKKVKGRILLLFDAYPYMLEYGNYHGLPQLTQWNLIEYSTFQNIIRKIYLIVPDNDWEKFQRNEIVVPIRQAGNLERGLFLNSDGGILMVATTPSSLPHISEETLVYINSRIFDHEQAMALLLRKKIASDIIISYEGHGR
jgi:hypothetical protein